MKKLLISLLIAVLAMTCVFTCIACGKGVECSAYSNGGLAAKDMLNGNVDYVIIDEAPAAAIAKSLNGQVKVINIKLTEEEYAFGVDKSQPELLAAANEVLAEITADGTFTKILDKYFNGEAVEGIVSATKDLNKADKQLVVATNAAFAPFEYKDGDKFAGVDMEIAAMIAEKLGLELVIDDMEFDSVVTSVGKNGVDIAMAGLTVNETRKEFVNFSNSYYNASQVLLVKADCTTFDACTTAAEIETILKDNKAKIGVQSGTTGELYVKGDADWGFEGLMK